MGKVWERIRLSGRGERKSRIDIQAVELPQG